MIGKGAYFRQLDFFTRPHGQTSRVPKSQLPKREAEICARLRAARERLALTQDACAAALGIERSTLSNYEYGKTPVRFDVALRFCRQLIVSEEWLATGSFAAMRAAAELRGQSPAADWESSLEPILFRQCMDLAAEKEYHNIPPGTLFSRAYDNNLAPVYARLAAEFYYWPRIVLSNVNEQELGATLLKAHLERYMMLLANEAGSKGRHRWEIQRQFIRAVFDAATVIFSSYRDTGLNDAVLQQLLQQFAASAKSAVGSEEPKIRRPGLRKSAAVAASRKPLTASKN
jgi:transcriptional regulator with XRE-family HTH domain